MHVLPQRLGEIENERNQFDIAETSYKNALRLQPTFSLAYVGLGELLAKLGRVDQANEYLQHALRVVPDPTPIEEAIKAIAQRIVRP